MTQKSEILTYARDTYGDEPEFLWPKFPTDFILRHPTNRKWYALFMTISRNKLPGETSPEKVEILDLRFPRNEALDFVANHPSIYPGYHMNKNNWITLILDGSLPTTEIIALLDQSYQITSSQNSPSHPSL